MTTTAQSFGGLINQAKAGDANSQFELAQRYWTGDGVRKNRSISLRWYREAARQGKPEHQLSFGAVLCSAPGKYGDLQEGLAWVHRAASQGLSSAQYFLASELASGESVTKNSPEAFKWYELAAAKGHPEAQYNLGIMLLEGEGTAKNIAEGQRWIFEAAKNGEMFAYSFLASCYRSGCFGFQKNEAKAIFWDEKYASIISNSS